MPSGVYNRNKKSMGDPMDCPECGLQCVNPASLGSHRRSKHGVLGGGRGMEQGPSSDLQAINTASEKLEVARHEYAVLSKRIEDDVVKRDELEHLVERLVTELEESVLALTRKRDDAEQRFVGRK